MKRISLLILVSVLLILTGFQEDNKKERKAKQQLEMAQLLQNGRFRFVARSANSELGNFTNLATNYDLVFDSLQLKAFLPYYGQAYSVPYGGSGGVHFDLKAEQIDKKWNERKKLFVISTNLSDSQDSYSIYLTAGLSGYADLKINFRNRRWISYYGTIEKIESASSVTGD
jgi:hypothetical protein